MTGIRRISISCCMVCAAAMACAPSWCAGERPHFTDKVLYYDDGRVRDRTFFGPDGRKVEELSYYDGGALEEMRRFDRDGRKVEEAHYDSDGHLEMTVDGWAAKRWLYQDGQLRAESMYGPDGRILERKLYNELGDLVGRQYAADAPIDDSEEFNRGSVVTDETDRFYDRYGRQTGSMTTRVDDPDDMFDGWPYWW